MDGIAGFKFEDKVYLYRKNVQGDITHIYRKELGKDIVEVARYAYDAWGNTEILSQTDKIGTLNPFRYRGYYFDIDTKLYYLISRYYDPETCRFISADGIEYLDPETLGGLNLYAYCCNNPVMGYDPEGTSETSFIIDLISSLFQMGIGGSLALVSRIIKTAARPSNIGIGTYTKNITKQLGNLAKASNILSKVSTAVAVISVAISVFDEMMVDINRGYSADRIVSNVITNTIVYGGLTFGVGLLCGKIGATLGSVVPGLGNVVGAAIGFAVGTVIGFLLEIKVNNKSIIEHIRDGVYSAWKWLFG